MTPGAEGGGEGGLRIGVGVVLMNSDVGATGWLPSMGFRAPSYSIVVVAITLQPSSYPPGAGWVELKTSLQLLTTACGMFGWLSGRRSMIWDSRISVRFMFLMLPYS